MTTLDTIDKLLADVRELVKRTDALRLECVAQRAREDLMVGADRLDEAAMDLENARRAMSKAAKEIDRAGYAEEAAKPADWQGDCNRRDLREGR
jgi:hypothetical protein